MSVIRSYKVYENRDGKGTLHVLIEQEGKKMLFDGWNDMPDGSIERNLSEWYINLMVVDWMENLVSSVKDGEEIGEVIADVILNSCLCLVYEEDEDNVDNNGGDPSEDDGNKDDIQEGNQGGLGTGETLFGSNEEFFDPEEGKVVYGDVITGYFGNINEKFSDGVIPEELREFFEKYYNILFGDKKDNE